MSSTDATTLQVPEHEALRAARDRSAQVGEVPSPQVTSLLRWVAVQQQAKTVVTIGSAAGLTGLALLDGMPQRSVLTAIERDVHRHEMARSTYEQVGVGSAVRAIQGDPAEITGRLSAAGYDLCVTHDTAFDVETQLDEVARLLKQGGVLVAAPLDDAEAGAAMLQAVLDDERFTSAHLAVDAGVVLATLA